LKIDVNTKVEQYFRQKTMKNVHFFIPAQALDFCVKKELRKTQKMIKNMSDSDFPE